MKVEEDSQEKGFQIYCNVNQTNQEQIGGYRESLGYILQKGKKDLEM